MVQTVPKHVDAAAREWAIRLAPDEPDPGEQLGHGGDQTQHAQAVTHRILGSACDMRGKGYIVQSKQRAFHINRFLLENI